MNWRAYLANYGIGLLVALNFMSFNLAGMNWQRLVPLIIKPVRWLAGSTFTLYLLHVPLAQFLAAISPWKIGTSPQQILVEGGTFGIVFLVAEYTERRKTAWRYAIINALSLKQTQASCARINNSISVVPAKAGTHAPQRFGSIHRW